MGGFNALVEVYVVRLAFAVIVLLQDSPSRGITMGLETNLYCSYHDTEENLKDL